MTWQKVDIQLNGVIVIQSLPSTERQTGRELLDDTISRLCHKSQMHSGIINIKSKAEFLQIGDVLVDDFRRIKLQPFLHFEIHGDEQGFMLANGEHVDWETVGHVMRTLNTVLKNNLFISLATCKGAFIVRGVANLLELAAFWGMVGPRDEIFFDEVIEDFTTFYTEFLTNFDLQKAVTALNNSNPRINYVVMTAEVIFDRSIERLLNDKRYYRQAKYKARIEKARKIFLAK